MASTQRHGVWGKAGSCALGAFVVAVVAELARGLSVLTGIHTCPDMHIVRLKCLRFRPSVAVNICTPRPQKVEKGEL